MIFQDLQQFGLSEKEARVYMALLEVGEASIGQITKKSSVKRTTVYDVIEALKTSGLVGMIKKDKKTLYFAEDPRSLEGKLEEKKESLKRMLPELLSITNLLNNKPKIRFYEGKEGIKEVYKDTLQYPNQELLAWVAEDAIEAFDETFLNTYYLPRRVEKKIWVRAIAPDLPLMQQYRGQDIPSLRKTRLIDAKRFPLDAEIDLYGRNRIAIMSFSEQTSLIIESEKIHHTLKSIFECQWESLA